MQKFLVLCVLQMVAVRCWGRAGCERMLPVHGEGWIEEVRESMVRG